MKLHLFFLLVLAFGSCSKTQNISVNPEKEIIEIPDIPDIPEYDSENTIGFACGVSGSSSNAVASISYLAENKEYDMLKSTLYKGTPAKRYLASVVCERLEKNKKLSLTPEERLQLIQNTNSEEEVHLCSGCTYSEKKSLKTLNNEEFFTKQVNEWLDGFR